MCASGIASSQLFMYRFEQEAVDDDLCVSLVAKLGFLVPGRENALLYDLGGVPFGVHDVNAGERARGREWCSDM